MGKGDKRTRRGKIFAGSYGKTRSKPHTPAFVAGEPKPVAEKPVKKRVAKRVPAAAKTVDAAPPPAEATEAVSQTPEAPVETAEAPADETPPTDETPTENAEA